MVDAEEILEELGRAGMLRKLRVGRLLEGGGIEFDGRRFLNFASNDYLGFAQRLDLQREFLESEAVKSGEFLMGAGASRLLGGTGGAFSRLEDFFAGEYSRACGGQKACLVFGCGYHANSGILPALFGPRDVVFCARLCHASIIDGLRLGRYKWFRFPHNDIGALDSLMRENPPDGGRACIVTESVFSMDGDRADLPALLELKRKYGARLYVDEAHAIGVFGGRGLGLCEELGIVGEVDFIVGTLGKAAASSGAFAICSPAERELLVNRCRPFIFTTAAAPISQMWTLFLFKRILEASGLRARLAELSKLFRESVRAPVLGDTQIVPVVLGGAQRALELSSLLKENGIYAPAVRPPTVPNNSSRVRFSLNAGMSEADVVRTAELVGRFFEGELR